MQTYADPRNVDDPLKIAADLASRQVPDAVDVLNALPIETTAGVVGLLPQALAIEMFDTPHFRAAARVLKLLPRPMAILFLTAMSDDRAPHMLRRLDEGERQELIDWTRRKPVSYGTCFRIRPARQAA